MKSAFVFKIMFISLLGSVLSRANRVPKSTARQIGVQTEINELKRELELLKEEVSEIRKVKDDVKGIKQTINNQGDIADKFADHIQTIQNSFKLQMGEFDRVIGVLDVSMKSNALKLKSVVEAMENKIMDSGQEISMNLTEIKDQLNVYNTTVSSHDATLMFLKQQVLSNSQNLQNTRAMLDEFIERVDLALKNTNDSINELYNARSSTTTSTTPAPIPVTQPPKSCRQNWIRFNKSCYLFPANSNTWYSAKKHCAGLRSNLIEIDSPSENTFIKEYIRKKASPKNHAYWIDGSDEEMEGIFIWTNSKRRFMFTDWAPGEPNNSGYGLNEHCVGLAKVLQFRWNDYPCSKTFNFICEEVLS